MNYEFGRLNATGVEGALIFSNDSRFPSANVYNGSSLVECRGSHDMVSEVRNGLGWKPNSFEIFREVDAEGEVVDWGFMMLPLLEPDTEELLTGLANNVRPVPGGKGKIEVYREIGGKLPRIVMKKNEKGIRIVAPGVASLKINDSNVQFREKTGGFDVPANSSGNSEAQYISVEVPLDALTFLPEEIADRKGYIIKSKVKLLQGPQEVLKRKIHEAIQEGSYTEKRLRSLVNISFSLGDTYEEESFA